VRLTAWAEAQRRAAGKSPILSDAPAPSSISVSDCHSLPPELQVASGDRSALDVPEEALGNDAQGIVVLLADGATVRLRPARSDDEQRLRSMFLVLPEKPAESPCLKAGALSRFLWNLGPQASSAVLMDARQPSAALGILLADSWQSRGLGRVA
jgi:hypothetical protein